MKQVLHVAQCAIAANRKRTDGELEPPIIVRNYKGAKRAHEVELVVDGQVVGKFVYRPHDPLPCGARLWLESDSKTLELRPLQVTEEFEIRLVA
ncbi:hypothetical protein [Sphingomonas jaspsi]|uniref:hypothetical protein n=1 Tax=Sphingomonas jaspsi TaxID=392409 RepID=UPI0004BA5775|nr:hypothetical protein [Sphingomonas jaspsi]